MTCKEYIIFYIIITIYNIIFRLTTQQHNINKLIHYLYGYILYSHHSSRMEKYYFNNDSILKAQYRQ